MVLALVILAACGSRGGSDEAFQWSSELPAGSVVHIRDGAGDIRVARAAGQAASVRGTRIWRKSSANDVRFVAEQRDGEYWICAMWRNSGRCAERGYRGRNTSGFLSMFSLFHRSSDARADFVVTLPPNVTLDARTTTGAIQVEGLRAGVTAHSTNGTVRATDVSGPLALSTTNGDIRLRTDSLAPTDSVLMTTTNGSVHAELPPGTQGAFDLSVVNGLVRSDFPMDSGGRNRDGNRVAGQVGAGARRIRARSINGQVTVTARLAPPAAGGVSYR